MDYMRARNWDQRRATMNRWGGQGENQVYADTQGHLGWVPDGLTPIWPNQDGLTLMPGEGRYEWLGFGNDDELPREFDPARGYVVTANANNIPPHSLAVGKCIGYERADSARSRRLKGIFLQKVACGQRFSLADSEAMQNDIVSSQAQRVVADAEKLGRHDRQGQRRCRAP